MSSDDAEQALLQGDVRALLTQMTAALQSLGAHVLRLNDATTQLERSTARHSDYVRAWHRLVVETPTPQ